MANFETTKKASLLKLELDKLRPIPKERFERIWQKLRLEWNFHSNSIEGNKLSYGETKVLLLHGVTASGKPLRDHFETIGHDEAVKWVLEIVNDRTITEQFIRELHKVILKEQYKKKVEDESGNEKFVTIYVGQYKKVPNHVRTQTGEMFYFASPEETPAKMTELIDWYRGQESKKDLNPIVLAATFHYRFIRIHPFGDGNGRTARILMNFILMKFSFPPVIVKTEDKENYYRALRQADGGEIEPFIEYIAENLLESLDIMIRGAKGENLEEEGDFEKELKLFEQSLKGIPDVTNYKSRDTLVVAFRNFVDPLVDQFLELSSRLEVHYFDTSKEARIKNNKNEETFSLSDFESIRSFKRNFRISTEEINLLIKFNQFKKEGIPDFGFHSGLYVIFEKKEILIKNGASNLIGKVPYKEEYSIDEIQLFAKDEIRRHMEYIQENVNRTQYRG